jgi:hypothetical protein
VRRISSSRPITGSNLPSAASLVKSYPNSSKAEPFCVGGAWLPNIPPTKLLKKQ